MLLALAETGGAEGLPEDEIKLVDDLELLVHAGREAKTYLLMSVHDSWRKRVAITLKHM